MRRIGSLIVIAALALTACTTERSEDGARSTAAPSSQTNRANAAPRVTAASLERFDACPPLVEHLRSEARKRVGPYGLPGSFGGHAMALDMAAGAESGGAPAQDSARAAAPPPQGGPPPQAGKDFSATNIQEAGVDEPDTIKTDGRHIFTLRPEPGNEQRQRLTSIDVRGNQPKIVGGVSLPESASYQLLLAGDRILAIGQAGYAIALDTVGREFAPGSSESPGTTIAIVDVADPTNMKITNKLELEGTYASARMIGGIARIVLNSEQSHIAFVAPAEPTLESEKKALATNRRLLDRTKIEDWLPRFTLQDAAGRVSKSGTLASCSSTFHPKTFSGFGTVSVVTLDPRNPDPQKSAAVVGSAGTVYASPDNLYVATQRWPEAQPLVLSDRAIGAPQPIPTPPKTQIHRFDISDATRATYAASGEVRGTVLNQWSLSEHGGHFRVATTEDRFGTGAQPPSSASFVTVLTASGGELKRVGSINDIAPGERIYGVRYIGDLGYVVTFKQIDPLHVIDFSDPANPKILGELEIPGYSAYLHPVAEGFLLGIGQDATLEGRPIGTVVSLFDVRDASNPKRLDKVTIRNAHSPVEHDHHAFLWWEPQKLAVVPADSFDEVAAREGKPSQTSIAYGYRVDGGRIDEVARISHDRHVEAENGPGSVQRSIVVGDKIYTLSYAGLLASKLGGGFEEIGWVALR